MKRTCIIVGLWLAVACTDRQPQNPSTTTMTQQHQDSVKRWVNTYIDEIWNKRNFSKADTYWGPDFKNVFAPQFAHGPEGMKQQVAYFLDAFDSFHFELKDILIQDDKVAIWVEISGTHTGELFGIKPTGKKVKFRECAWYKIKDGKLDEVYPFVDWNDLFEQLGQYPPIETKK